MTGLRIERFAFTDSDVTGLSRAAGRYANWPVVYTLSNDRRVYVGESLNVANRMRQHRDSGNKTGLSAMRIVIDDTFNKSVCLDLESFLIRLFAGDGTLEVLNRNNGITDADYFDRPRYRDAFQQVFDALRDERLFTRTIPEIENSDLFKLSPFKSLNTDQAAAVEDIVEGLLDDLGDPATRSTLVVRGGAGTGKTVIGIYLMKLLRDIALSVDDDEPDHDSLFSEFFVPEHRELLQHTTIAMVVPQQSLRKSIAAVFRKTPGLQRVPVLSPAELAKSGTEYDVVVVDEAHRLGQRANQASGPQNTDYTKINLALFGNDDLGHTQLDWVRKCSRHQVLLLDERQSVRPADLPNEITGGLLAAARDANRLYPLQTQMRVRAGSDYPGFIREVLEGAAPAGHPDLGDYDLRFFDDLPAMHEAVRAMDARHGLARLVAGYAWPWRSKADRGAADIELDGHRLQWNRTDKDWINSPGAIDEVGSIHTVQGYDLNYAGVIIGPDLRFDAARGGIVFDRSNYFDKKGKENNPKRGLVYTDDDLLAFVRNIYSVLLTRGIRGTYVYVCDPELREWMRGRFAATRSSATPAARG